MKNNISFPLLFQAGVYMAYIVTNFSTLNILGTKPPNYVRGMEVI